MTPKTITYQQSELQNLVATTILPLLKQYGIFALTGPLGAGKTTLVKELLRQAGVTDVVTSPTFAYVNTYTTTTGQVFHHFDLYRLGNIEEFFAAGFDEYLHEPGAVCLIEWPEIIAPLLLSTGRTCTLALEHNIDQPNQRTITIWTS